MYFPKCYSSNHSKMATGSKYLVCKFEVEVSLFKCPPNFKLDNIAQAAICDTVTTQGVTVMFVDINSNGTAFCVTVLNQIYHRPRDESMLLLNFSHTVIRFNCSTTNQKT